VFLASDLVWVVSRPDHSYDFDRARLHGTTTTTIRSRSRAEGNHAMSGEFWRFRDMEIPLMPFPFTSNCPGRCLFPTLKIATDPRSGGFQHHSPAPEELLDHYYQVEFRAVFCWLRGLGNNILEGENPRNRFYHINDQP